VQIFRLFSLEICDNSINPPVILQKISSIHDKFINNFEQFSTKFLWKMSQADPKNLQVEIRKTEQILEDLLKEIEEEKMSYRKMIDEILEKTLSESKSAVVQYHEPYIDVPKLKEDFEVDLIKYSEIMDKFNSDSDHLKGSIFVTFEDYIQDSLNLPGNCECKDGDQDV
jgi:hypothetical protein